MKTKQNNIANRAIANAQKVRGLRFANLASLANQI